ncbi:MAG: hypothetical protein HYW23_00485 [Candidatus Aenigmarchaeota archaeon]|nr:hypothetical protein [Candidatus Aenigmarchaeota archaeon]
MRKREADFVKSAPRVKLVYMAIEKEPEFDFLNEVFDRMILDREISSYRKSIIPFPLIFKRLGVVYHFSKKTSLKFLKVLEKRGYIKLVNFHGIKVTR